MPTKRSIKVVAIAPYVVAALLCYLIGWQESALHGPSDYSSIFHSQNAGGGAGVTLAAHQPASRRKTPPERMLVVPKMRKDDVSWLDIWLPDLPKTVYTPDDPTTPHHVPKNRGLEAEVGPWDLDRK